MAWKEPKLQALLSSWHPQLFCSRYECVCCQPCITGRSHSTVGCVSNWRHVARSLHRKGL